MRRLGIVIGSICIILAGFASQFTLAAPASKGPMVGDVYVLNSGVGTNQQLCDQAACSPMTVASMILPAGSYTISAKLVFARWSSTAVAQSFCYLYAGATQIDAIAAATSLEIENMPGALQGARTFSGPETLAIKCADNNGLTSVQNWQLMATKVGTINVQ